MHVGFYCTNLYLHKVKYVVCVEYQVSGMRGEGIEGMRRYALGEFRYATKVLVLDTLLISMRLTSLKEANSTNSAGLVE